MGYVSSDIDLAQMEKAKGWSDFVYREGWQIGHLGAWRAPDIGTPGSNLSIWRASGVGTPGSNLSIWRATEGLSNIATLVGKTAWEGNDLLLLEGGATATISPYGGSVYIVVSKERQHRDANSCGQTSNYGSWSSYSSETITVQSGRKQTITQNERAYKGGMNKGTCSSNWACQCWSDWKYRTRIQLASFVPDGSGEDNNDVGPTPGPNPNPSPVPGLSPTVALPWVAGIAVLGVVGFIAYKFIASRGAVAPK
jgi:hypothetical protein